MPETAENGAEPDEPPVEPAPELSDDDAREVAEKARREAAKLRRDLRAAQQANDELRAAEERRRVESESEQERAVREAVEAARTEWDTEHAAERLHSRLRVRAAGRLRDPDDAVLHLGGTLPPDADDAAIDEAIAELVKQRDYLAAPPANGTDRGGLVTQGARSSAAAAGREQSPDDWIRARARNR